MKKTPLTIYEFDSKIFVLQDEQAGYYVSKHVETLVAKYHSNDLFDALKERNVEIKIVSKPFTLIRDKITQFSFCWSMCRMKNAK